jgi:ADP-ribosylglycohydrolase
MIEPDDATMVLASRLAGAVWGVLVGDAVGVPYEFGPARPAEEVVFGHPGGPWRQPAGTWSDDGALTLALLDSLLHAGPEGTPAFDLEDQGRRFRQWRDHGSPYTPDGERRFDVGATTFRALARLDEGVEPGDAGPRGERECGNGSLMRILPLALVQRDAHPLQLIEAAHRASRVTHGHPRCQVACAMYCLAVAGLLRGDDPAAALATAFAECERVYADERGYESHLGALHELRGFGDRTGSGFVLDAFWSAWDAFAGAADYADAVRRAVAYGHDTDTTAAIAGGLAGAHFGWESIPRAWLHGMRGKAVAQPLVDVLVATTGRVATSTASPLRIDHVRLNGTTLEGTGRVGLTFLPGKKVLGNWTGRHWRDLDLDLASLREAGADTLLLLNEDHELTACRVEDIETVFAAAGSPEFVRFPIPDPHVPRDLEGYRLVVRQMVERVRNGQFVVIACRGGLDRTGMTAACLLREAGVGADEAIARVQAARKHTITIAEQQAVVRDW